ncbi:MAG: RNA polymerase sigma factor [Lachnospiraceae bacterium]|nr:RNA polymerase sigma factor [Lachnospiraceae bacterium]
MEETELVKRMIAGDEDAFAGIMEIYQPQALRAAYLISGNYADSEDIVQETFVACFLNRHKLREPAAFKGWFYKTLSRNAWRICRKKKKEQPAAELYPEDLPAPGLLLSRVILAEEEKVICDAIEALPIKQRTVIVLYYYNEMSIKEIAKVCGCLEGTVKSRLFNGKARLKELLSDREEKGGTAWTILS